MVLIGSKREDRRNNRNRRNAGVNVRGHNRYLRIGIVYIRPLVNPINNRESSRFSNKDFCMES